MDKTVVVTVIRRVRDRRFHKFLTRRVKYHAHDEKNTAKVGDLVEIVESRPMSRTKRWRLLAHRCSTQGRRRRLRHDPDDLSPRRR